MDDIVEPSMQSFRLSLDEESEHWLTLTIIEYSNAIQASLYDGPPSLGSMSLAYPIMDQAERQSLFGGKHSHFADALALLLAKQSNKIIYASVNLQRDTVINIDLLRQLVTKYTTSTTAS